MTAPSAEPTAHPWRCSAAALALLAVAAIAVGFLALPAVQRDYVDDGLWASLCRAAGVPERWDAQSSRAAKREGASTARDAGGGSPPAGSRVVITAAMARPGAPEAVGRGATLALQCSMCHGARGVTASDAPNLAGQHPEVLAKQLHDYRDGRRSQAVMSALAADLGDGDIADLSAYYASLPKVPPGPEGGERRAPDLVRVGAPLRNVAPCASCHGGIDRKLGAPWLDGLPRAYLVEQLQAFARGERRNDAFAQMRAIAAQMTPQEIEAVADWYARAPGGR